MSCICYPYIWDTTLETTCEVVTINETQTRSEQNFSPASREHFIRQ